MRQDLDSLFSSKLLPDDDHHGDRQALEIRYAAAALLVVCAKSDFDDHPEEERQIIALLENTFDLDQELIGEILSVLDEDMVLRGVQQFTGLVNQHYTRDDKIVLMENLWKVAFADGHLDRFEEQFINRVAFMIKLSAEDVADCRDTVQGQS